MPTTHVSTIPSMARYLSYVTRGNGATYRQNVADGTVRYLAQDSDLGSVDNTIAYVGAVRSRFPVRRLEGYDIRVSWSRDELDPNNPDDVRTAMAFGHDLVKAVFPDCPAVVTAHGDGDGGCLHLHIAVVNHNMVTDKAIRGNGRDHRHIAAISDRIATEEYHFRKVERHRSNEWSLRRQELESAIEGYEARESGKWSKAHREAAVRLALGDAVAGALDDERVTDLESFEQVLFEEYGCEIRRKEIRQKDGTVVVGFTYAMPVELEGKTRKRRSKASAVCPGFDAAHIEQTIDAYIVERKRREAIAEAVSSGSVVEDPVVAPSRDEQLRELVESHSLIRRVPVRDEDGRTTAIQLVPHELLFESQSDRDAATFTLRVGELRDVVAHGVEEANDGGFLERYNALPPVDSVGAVAKNFCEDYETAAERVVGADTSTGVNAKTFVGEVLSFMAKTAKRAWSRLSSAAFDLSRRYGLGFEDKDYQASFSAFVRNAVGRRRREDDGFDARGSVVMHRRVRKSSSPVDDAVEPAVERSAEQSVADAIAADDSAGLRDAVEYSRKARERERVKKQAQQRKKDAAKARQRSMTRRNSGRSRGHGGLGS